MCRAMLVIALCGLGLAAWPAQAQLVPAPGAILPDLVGPVLDERADPPAYEPLVPGDTPAAIAAIDLASRVGSLPDALTRAYWFNPQLLAERAILRSVDFRLPQARAQFGPRIDYSFDFGWQRDNFETAGGGYFPRSGQSNTVSAILTQPIYSFGRLAAGERAARAQIAFQRAGLRNAEQQILFGAIAAYVGVLRDRAGLQIAEDNLTLLERELSDNRARLAVRETTSADLQQVETRASFARAELLTARAALDASEASFRSVVGSPAGELAPPNPLQFPASSLDGAQGFAEANNPVLAAAQAREQVSRAARDAARAERLPRVDFQGRADFGTISPYSNDLRQNTLRGGIVLSGPLFDSGLLAARQQEADAANDADWRLIDNAARELRAEVAGSWSAQQASRASVEHLAAAVAAADKAYDGAQVQQRAGFRTTLDVLNLARDLLTVRNSYNSTIANAYLSEARLLLALGALEQSYLLPDAARHDPAVHGEKVDGAGDIPLWTPVLEAIDGIGYAGANTPRPHRDPALRPAGEAGDEAP